MFNMEMKNVQKLAGIVNALLVGCLVWGMFSFHAYGVTYMFYHCIPTIAMLLLAFYPLYKQRLQLFVVLLYVALSAYMAAATICLGYSAGFHLYALSLTPLAFYMEYMAFKLGIKRMSAVPASLALTVIYFVTAGYTILHGPVYTLDAQALCGYLYVNAGIVFFYVIGYAYMMFKLIMDSERKLTEMANTDRLTGLFNRHYMNAHLEALFNGVFPGQWIAMADIDDFKQINDTYGHVCGDYVLAELAKIMREVCPDCAVSRWGGEEFLLISSSPNLSPELMEKLRRCVEEAVFTYQGRKIPVTITVGVSRYQEELTLTGWIQCADAKLYAGKEKSKNCVVY